MTVVFQQVVIGGTVADQTFGVTLRDNADAVTFRLFIGHPAAPDPASFDNTCDEACAQHWRQIGAPILDSVRVESTDVHVFWTNQNPRRAIDSTEIFRDGALVGETFGTTNTFTDGAVPAGVHAYQLRHVAPPSPNAPTLLSRPNSPFSAESTTRVGPPPPYGLGCEGNFAPTMDCHWINASPTDSIYVYRGGGFQARLAPGTTAWTDPAVTRGATYVYDVRHVRAGIVGEPSAPATAVANPVPPENLSCGRTGATTASCAWVPKEPADTVEIQHTSAKTWVTRGVLAPGASYLGDTALTAGVAYTYRARYRRGSDASAWSNTDAVGTTWPEPYGPQP